MKLVLKTALLSTALGFAAHANAAVIASLTFNQPTGTVLSNAPVDVFLTLKLDPGSDALTTDATGKPTSGFNFGGYTGPIDLNDPHTRVSFNEFYQCGGTFVGLCGPGPYGFNFNFAQPNFIGPVNFNLQPGQSFSWLFGTFTPTGGNAPPGQYSFFNAGAGVEIFNNADPVNPVFDFVNIAQTCPGQTPDCAFTRDVIAAQGGVPEPAAWALMIAGFGLTGAAMRRRSRVTVTYA
jgi:hypothetical protein